MQRVLFALALGAAAVFAYGVIADHHALRLAVKLVPVLAMITWVARIPSSEGIPSTQRRYTVAGLAASLAGDLLLELDPARLFVPGLVAFLVAHVLYVVAYTATARSLALGRALPAFGYGALVLGLLWSGLGPMRLPVTVYTVVICAMLWRAAARVGVVERVSARLALAGAISFAVSDSMIAFGRFGDAYLDETTRHGWPWRLGIMSLYWLGQWGIASAVPRRS